MVFPEHASWWNEAINFWTARAEVRLPIPQGTDAVGRIKERRNIRVLDLIQQIAVLLTTEQQQTTDWLRCSMATIANDLEVGIRVLLPINGNELYQQLQADHFDFADVSIGRTIEQAGP